MWGAWGQGWGRKMLGDAGRCGVGKDDKKHHQFSRIVFIMTSHQ